MTDTPSTLALSEREGLPDDIAFLRDAYPPSSWREHSNFGDLAAFWLQVHESLRREGSDLEEATRGFREGRWQAGDFQQFFMPKLGHYLQHLDGHHQIEDVHYFPRFRRLDKRMIRGFDLLENDHEFIHRTLIETADKAQGFMQSLRQSRDAARYAADAYADHADDLLRLLDRHLADEEDLVLPAMLEHGERPLR